MPGRTLPIKTTFARTQTRRSPSPPISTNTLVLAGVPQHFFHPTIMDVIRSHFEAYGQLHTFAPLKAFGRVIVVYFDEDSAERGKMGLDWIQLDEANFKITLRVFRGDPTPISPTASETRYLAPPAQTKNFLISPPGSPPVGWEQIREDPPNATPLADDLMSALLRLKERQEMTMGGERRTKNGCEVLWHADETAAGVGIYVENCTVDVKEVVESEEDDEGTGEGFWYGHEKMKGVVLSMSETSTAPPPMMHLPSSKTSMPIPKTAMPPRQRS